MNNTAANLRVLRVYTRHPPMAGGMERHIQRLSQAQRDLGVEVVNVYNTGDAGEFGVRIWPRLDLSGGRPASLHNAFFELGAILSASRLRSPRPTVLHVHGAWSDFLLSGALAKLVGARAVFASLHDVFRPASPDLNARLLSHCDGVFTTGRQERDLLAARLKAPVIHLPSVPADIFFETRPQAERTIDVIVVANLVAKKRLDLVLDCAAARPDWRFAILGEGPMRAALEAGISGRGLLNVRLLGRLEPAQVAQFLAQSRLLLSTAQSEGTPTSALEAMAVGLPVVLAPSNDYGWLVRDGVNGFVTRGWAPEDFVGAMDVLLKDPAAAAAMGERNRELMASFSWPASARTVTDQMISALARRSHG